MTTTINTLRFTDLHLTEPLLQALAAEGYEIPTPIQQQAIPHILARRDLLGCAQTGTGKTAAFALPILQLLAEKPHSALKGRRIRCLVLTPTRELAAQIAESFDRYGLNLHISNTVIFGGVGQSPQAAALRRGVDILVATPGRLLDLMEQKLADLSSIEIFVLDEADRMLDMGFIHDVRRIIKALPKKRHSLFFSATMPTDIKRLAQDILTDPVKVEVTPVASTAEKVDQSVYFVEKTDKRFLLEELMKDKSIQRALVFSRTKHGADRIAKFLNFARVSAEAIHGNKSQNNRIRALNNFKEGLTRVLVATDIAARGIDIDGVTHVINFELPNIPESYVHRIGRTARAGNEGIAISFCDQEEREYLADIEKLIRMRIRVATHSFKISAEQAAERAAPIDRNAGRPHAGHRAGGRSDNRTSNRPANRAGSRPSGRSDNRAGYGSQGPRTNDRPSQGSNRSAPRSGASSSDRPSSNPTHSRSSSYAPHARSSSNSARRPTPVGGQPRSSSAREPLKNSARQGSDSTATKAQSTVSGKQPWWKKLVSSKK